MHTRILLGVIVSVLVGILGTVGAVSPASAAAAPVVVSPAAGGTLPVGSTGPLVIDVSAAGRHYLSVRCETRPGETAYVWLNGANGVDYAAGRQNISIAPLVGIGEELSGARCQIKAYGAGTTSIVTSTFTVVGSSVPTVVSPPPGGALVRGSTGPLVIDFPVVAGKARVSVRCGELLYDDASYIWLNGADGVDYAAGRQTIAIDPLDAYAADLSGAACSIEVSGTWFKDVYSTFTVAAPTLILGDVSASKPAFYPLVKDGYLDETVFRFNVNRSADATLTLKDSDGKTVYAKTKRVHRGRVEWPWNGKTTSGKRVKPGKYSATVSSAAEGATFTSATKVRVVTKKVTKRVTVREDGWDGRDSTRGNCVVHTDTENYTAILDCWGGAFAASTYTFKVPADATNIRWGAVTGSTSLDKCCRGSITKRAGRVGKTKFQIRVQVTGWRAIEVQRAWVSFSPDPPMVIAVIA